MKNMLRQAQIGRVRRSRYHGTTAVKLRENGHGIFQKADIGMVYR